MGRNRKSTEEKVRKGNPGRRKLDLETDVEIITDSTPPKDMDEKQKRYWNKYASYMVRACLLTDLNITDLERLCYYEAQLDDIHKLLLTGGKSLLQEKKNYHGDVVDLVEGVYSKLSRNYNAVIRVLKADLRLRTDKQNGTFKPKPKSKIQEFMERKNGKK